MSSVEANVKIDGLLGFEAYPGIYVMEDGKIELKEAVERASIAIEDGSGPIEVPSSVLDRAEDLDRAQRHWDELTNKEAPKND